MSKYIIELDENAKEVVVISLEDGDMWTETVEVEDLEQLNSDYINEHYGELQDEAYQKGINDGSLDVKQRVEGAYQAGLNDAWEAVKKIFGYEIDGALSIDEIGEAFGYKKEDVFYTADIIRANTAEQVIAKLKAYEEKQDNKFEFGDEITDSYGTKGCVVSKDNEEGEMIYALFDGYRVPQHVAKSKYRKTGKHYDIEKILEALKA